MKRALVLFLAVVASLAVAQEAWQTVTSTEAKFTVKMPGKPQTSTQKYMSGKYSIPTDMYVVSKPNANYVLTVSTLPKDSPANFADELMKATQQGFLQSISGTALTEKDVAYNNLKGHQITFKAPNGAEGAFWMLSKNGRLYTLTLAKRAEDYKADQAKFFGSFHLKS